MNDTLEALLLRIAGMEDRARAIVEAEYCADEDNDPDDELDFEIENKIWLGLEQNVEGGWGCGWLMRPDEATEFVIEANGATPMDAAQALLLKMDGWAVR